MRAESGKPIERPLGSPIVLSDWHKLLFNPVHLFRLPTADGVQIQTSTTIGPRARKPLQLEIPILITGMSYGGALSLKAKTALAIPATESTLRGYRRTTYALTSTGHVPKNE
jgi:hypothetical protein